MHKAKKNLLIALILISGVALDQISKLIAVTFLKGTLPLTFLWNMFRLEYAENPGAFLGMGSELSSPFRFWIFTVLVGVFLILCLLYLISNRHLKTYAVISFSLMIAGGLSNFFDRTLRDHGRVVDFLNLGIGSLRTGIFNIADMLIMIGIFMLLIQEAKQKSK